MLPKLQINIDTAFKTAKTHIKPQYNRHMGDFEELPKLHSVFFHLGETLINVFAVQSQSNQQFGFQFKGVCRFLCMSS